MPGPAVLTLDASDPASALRSDCLLPFCWFLCPNLLHTCKMHTPSPISRAPSEHEDKGRNGGTHSSCTAAWMRLMGRMLGDPLAVQSERGVQSSGLISQLNAGGWLMLE